MRLNLAHRDPRPVQTRSSSQGQEPGPQASANFRLRGASWSDNAHGRASSRHVSVRSASQNSNNLEPHPAQTTTTSWDERQEEFRVVRSREHTNTPWFHGRAHAETAGGLVAGSFGRQDQPALSWAITATIHLTQAISEDRHRGTAQKFCKIHQAWSVYPKDSRAQGSTAT